MVGSAAYAVHRGRPWRRRHPAFPQARGRIAVSGCRRAKRQRVAMTCAQIAIMPRNNASEARAAASSKTARNIATSQERRGNNVHILFGTSSVVSSDRLFEKFL